MLIIATKEAFNIIRFVRLRYYEMNNDVKTMVPRDGQKDFWLYNKNS